MSFVKDIERVAIAVRDLDRAQEFFEKAFDAEFEGTEDVKDMKFRYTPFTVGGKKLELLSPYDDDSPIARFLKKRGEGIHHISFEVDDIEQAIAELKKRGVEIAYRHQYAPDVSFEGYHWDEAFIHPRDAFGVLIHLVQKRKV